MFLTSAPRLLLPVAVAIESHVFGDLGPETSANYRDKIRSLFTNLKNKSHPELRQRVATGDIPAQRFARMTNEELKSPERLAEERAIQKENMDKAMVAQQEESISPSLVCGKCGGRKVSYSQAQTRSADEVRRKKTLRLSSQM